MSIYAMVRQTQKMRKIRNLLSGAAGRKPIIDDMRIFLAALQHGTENELFTDEFRNAAKKLRLTGTLTAIVLKMRCKLKRHLIFRVNPLVVRDKLK